MLDLKAFKTARFSTGFSFPWCIKYMIISCANRSTQDDKNKKFTNNRDKWEGFVLHKQQFYEIMEFTAFNESAIVFQEDLSLCAFMN